MILISRFSTAIWYLAPSKEQSVNEQIKCDLRTLKYSQNGAADEIAVVLVLNFQKFLSIVSVIILDVQKWGFQTRHLNKSNKANYTHIWKRDTNNLCLQNKFICLLLAKRFLHSDNSRKILAVLWVRLSCQETQGIIPWKVKHSKIWAAAQHATRSSRSPPRAGSNTGCQHGSHSSSPVCVLLIATSQRHACVMATRFVPGCISIARTTLT